MRLHSNEGKRGRILAIMKEVTGQLKNTGKQKSYIEKRRKHSAAPISDRQGWRRNKLGKSLDKRLAEPATG
jgi:hypothetical protein